MVNYLYDPSQIEANHEAFVHGGRVARGGDIGALLELRPKLRRTRRRLGAISGKARSASLKGDAAPR